MHITLVGENSAYWTYATQSNTTPSNVLSATGTNNANFATNDIEPPNYGFTDHTNYLTPVGTFAASPDPMARSTRTATCGSGMRPPTGATGGSAAAEDTRAVPAR